MKFELNKDGRDFFVGDLHGCYDAFMNALARVDFDFEKDRVFSVGDLIDRGTQSVECLQLLNKPWFHAVRGNHEELMLGSHSYYVWMINGGEWSNSIEPIALDELKKLVSTMPLFLTIETSYGVIGVIHAEPCDDWNNNSEEFKELHTWSRSRIFGAKNGYIDPPIANIDLVVVGHTPVNEVLNLGNMVYIDTGAVFKDGYLTLLSVEELFNV